MHLSTQTMTMNDELHTAITAVVAAAGPVALLGFGLLPGSLLARNPRSAARAGALLALGTLGSALALVCLRVAWGTTEVSMEIAGPFHVGVRIDNLSVILLLLVAFLLAVVSRYAVNYLAGDSGQGRFTRWLCVTGGSVMAMILSGNLVQFTLAWCATSLGLHRLLVFYPERPGALIAARKKFIISRMGDACLLVVILLVHRSFGTWEFTGILEAARRLHEPGGAPVGGMIHTIAFLLVAGAMLKSAQFPFHSWLPDTMETPTPVSALMHAGVINAGGFLIIRLSPLVTLSPLAMSTLALFGAFTALFASLVMLTHASVKRALAFSTVAQMGFMMLECGLGAFGLAVLHLVAHSLYKAHAFLSSGSIVSMARAAWVPTARPNAHPLALGAAFATGGALVWGAARLCGVGEGLHAGTVVLACTYAMALAYALWILWSQRPGPGGILGGVVLGGGLAVTYFTLEKWFVALLGERPWQNGHLDSWPGRVVIGLLLGLFLVVLVLQTELPAWAARPWLQRLYVHARNGFYFNTLANRCVAAVWPARTPENPTCKP
ncbi:MAG TPA: hypothetical protein DCM86_05595 [Verrucomicrobiales bacterium]|nr:hypothetical protein [Verrucomicrobiales bacterium]